MGQGWSRNYPESLGTWVLTGNPCGVSCAHRFPENVLTHCTTIYWIVSVLSKLNSQRRTCCSYRSATRDVFPRFLRKLAQRKHFPAINWNISFSKYIRSWSFKVLHSLICRVQAAEKDLFSHVFFGIAHLQAAAANSVWNPTAAPWKGILEPYFEKYDTEYSNLTTGRDVWPLISSHFFHVTQLKQFSFCAFATKLYLQIYSLGSPGIGDAYSPTCVPMCKVRMGLNSTDLNNTHYVTIHTTFTKSWLFIYRGMLQQKMKEILQKEDDLQEIVQSLVSAKDRSWMLPPFFVAL